MIPATRRLRRRPSPARPARGPALGAAAALLFVAVSGGPSQASGAPGPAGDAGVVCAAPVGPALAVGGAALDPERVEMAATRRARGGSGAMTLRLSSSPFGVALAEDGSYRHHVEVEVDGLPPASDGTYVVWAATPELDRHRKLGAVGGSGRVSGEVAWNKFMIFVTAESSADVEEWSQSIVLSARSPSGRMHTMAGHGPFSGEPCLDPRP